jgi:hypothetical protein
VKPRLELRTGQVWLDDGGIVRALVSAHAEIDLEEAREWVRVIAVAGEGKKRPVLVYLGGVKSMSREARLHMGGTEGTNVMSAGALIVASPLARAIGTFFTGLNRTVVPTKLFADEATAVVWLRGFL